MLEGIFVVLTNIARMRRNIIYIEVTFDPVWIHRGLLMLE
jgi:hypothetical protein